MVPLGSRVTRTSDEIVNLWHTRRAASAKIIGAGTTIRQIYNGEHPITLPELERTEHPSIANLIQSGIDQHATRIASIIPNIVCPPVKPTKAATDRADDRRLTLQAWWYQNHIPRMLRRRARHLVGYASTPVLLRPHADGYPTWEVRDPLSTFPAPSAPEDLNPTDCIFAFRRTRQWLLANYGVNVGTGRQTGNDVLIDVLQYVDADCMVMIAVGTTDTAQQTWGGNGSSGEPIVAELSRVTNRVGQCPVVIVGRITLDRLQGQFDQMVGMYESEGILWGYHLHAVKRSIFGETWLSGRPNETPNIVQVADPYQGDVGVVEGGQLVQFKTDPGVQTIPSLNMLERNQRLTGFVPSEFGAESPTNVRTDRRGQSVVGGAVDFPVQEHQELLAASLEAENKLAIAISKAYWPNTSKTFVVPFGTGQVTYTPALTFDTDMHRVSYAYAGTDTNTYVIEGGQRIGQGTLSKRSFMFGDPMVSDPDAELRQIELEGIQQAFLQSIQTQASQPESPYTPDQLARLHELMYEKKLPLYEAVQKLHSEAQAAQANQPAMVGAAAQPGLGAAGAPGTPGAAIPPPGQAQGNLMDLLNTLRRPQAGPFGTGAGAHR